MIKIIIKKLKLTKTKIISSKNKKVINTMRNIYNNKKRLWLSNNDNSCAYDCITTINIFSILPFINKNKDKLIIEDNNIKNNFNLYNNFVNELINNYNNKEILFYEFYQSFIIKNNDLNFLGILDSEIGEFIPIVSTFRIFNDINLFYISYNRKMLCNGLCYTRTQKILFIIHLVI